MGLHQASGRWQLGLGLTLATALFWATLPIALTVALEILDPITLTWFRFIVAAAVTAAWLGLRGGLRGYGGLARRHWLMLIGAAVLLLGNYMFYLLGVQHTTPANAQLLIQLAPLLMALGGIWVFGERFRVAQWLGLALTFAGLLLFFRDQLLAARHAPGYGIGSAWVILGAVVLAGYALLQKQLLARLGSMQILLLLYVAASIALLPFAHPAAMSRLDGLHWAMLGYCALNTIGAYGAFAEALAHWEASRVSAILATTPLLCIGAVALVHTQWPHLIAAERISTLGYAGSGLVVAGSAAVSLLGRRAAR